MSEQIDVPEEKPESKRSRFTKFLKTGLDKGLARGKEEALKGEAALKKAVGLGPSPNAIPPDDAIITGDLRLVEIGWHPVPGMAFMTQTALGKALTNKLGKHPDPTQHWAVLVGDYCHQLWMDEKLDIIYTNAKIDRADWHTFEVGKTRFNDEALRQAGEMTIHNMREKNPAYNLISQNCQTYAAALLDAIQAGAHREFGTTFAIYQRATGKGAIKDLFVDSPPDQQMGQQETGVESEHGAAVHHAQQIMDDNTTKLDH